MRDVQRLFTPWRMKYVTTADKIPGCILCQARDGVDEDRLIVHRGEHNFLVMNLYPYNSGHVMIAPRRHISTLAAATPEELTEMMTLAQRLEQAMKEAYRPDGVNLRMNLGRPAGAGVPDHLHLHLVPRWSGDTSFMTVVGGTRVIPEDPAEGCLKLRPYFAK
jgi:ATP adenylyltransferase